MLTVVLLGALLSRFLKANPAMGNDVPEFDPDYCFRIIRLAALACVLLVTIETLILALVDPGASRCPGWTITLAGGAAISLGPATVFVCIPAAICLCVIVFRWRHFVSRVYGSIGRPIAPFTHSISASSGQSNLDVNRLFLVVTIGWCLFCSIPLWMMLFGCARILG
jgi:hypothetical protein